MVNKKSEEKNKSESKKLSKEKKVSIPKEEIREKSKIIENKQETQEKPKPKIELIQKQEFDEEFEDDFIDEDFVEDFSLDNLIRRRQPRPFLESRPIINLEQGLEDVPTSGNTEEENQTPGYTLKSNYASANLYSSNGANTPQKDSYSSGTNPTTPDIFSPADNSINIEKWRQSNVDQATKQQDNYTPRTPEKMQQEERDMTGSIKKKDKWTMF